MKSYVYILKDKNGRFYVGSTSDLDRRMKQHLNGRTQTTARMVGLKLVLIQKYETLAQARKVELRIKRLKRKDYIERMVLEKEINMHPSFNG